MLLLPPPPNFFKNNKEKNTSTPELIKSKPRETAAALTAFQRVHAVHQMKRDKTNTSVVDPFIFFFICVHIDGAVTQKRAKGVGRGDGGGASIG